MSSSSDDEDVKALLGRALAGEPPLTLDRDEVFRTGRRKLRNRRVFSAGGAIAGVVAAAVGAVLVTGLLAGETGRELPPAASRTGHPVPSGPSSTTAAGPSSAPARPPLSVNQADRLTALLAKSRVLDADTELTAIGGGEARFRPGTDAYELEADVSSSSAEGSLSVSVGWADAATGVGCEWIEDRNAGCEVRTVAGSLVAVATSKDSDTGVKRYTVFMVRPDGTSVTASASNLSERQRRNGKRPTDKLPVVDAGTLVGIAANAGLRFHG
ncbi:hypothetical protein [Actinophytocola sp.]|uniref:hypothetical protein n=1 Tax=Actinophytocola sp. TaxID=1872138 RepID=UPI003D6ACA84